MTQAAELAAAEPRFRCYADNVLIELEPEPKTSKGGIAMVHQPGPKATARGNRAARVIDAGPGHFTRPSFQNPRGVWQATQVKPGDRVIVDRLAGQNYAFDISAPRQHEQAQDFQRMLGRVGEFRVVREAEILGVVEEGVEVM